MSNWSDLMSDNSGTWKMVPLPEVLDFREGPGIMACDFRDEGIPLLRLAGLKRGASLLDGCNYLDPKMVDARWTKFRVRPDDVLLSTSASLGEVAVVSDEAVGGIPYTGIIRFRPRDARMIPEFVEFALRAPSFKIQIEAMGVGSVMRHFGPMHLRQMTVNLPLPGEQAAIAGVLTALDDKIAVNDRIVRKSRALMAVKYVDAVDFGVNPVMIRDVADLFDGPHATPKKTESGPWFLSISSLNDGRLELGESAHLSDDDFVRWTRRVTPQAGDVLFSYETRLGEAALMPTGINACLGRRMALLRSRAVGPRTLLQAFLSSSFQETIRQYAVHGATVDRIPLTEFPSWRINLPTNEPHRLEAILCGLDELAERRERENETLAEMRDTLLPKLMSGEIRVREVEKVVEDVT